MFKRDYLIYEKALTEHSAGEADFGVRDQKGRAVGYKWVISKVVYTQLPDTALGGYILPAGLPLEHLEVRAFPTRNGHHYGASSGPVSVRTEDEAAEVVAKRIEQARKRDSKKFGGAL